MGNISVSLPSDGETIDAADYNTPINTIVTEINGNLDNSNISTSAAISGTKLANDSIPATKIDWASTGVDGGIWWEELGRTTLSVAGDTITVAVANRKYLMIYLTILSTGGTTIAAFRFNSDTAANYTTRNSTNGAGDASSGGTTSLQLSTATNGNKFCTAHIVNIAAQEKLMHGMVVSNNAAGAGNAADKWDGTGKWANTADAITSISAFNSGTGDYAIGSELVVLGHN